MEFKEKRRISNGLKWFLIGFTVIVDLVQILLNIFGIGVAVNRFISAAMDYFILALFVIKGISIADPRKLLSLVGTSTGEQVPALDMVPFWTLYMIYIVHTVRKEDDARIAKEREAFEEEHALLAAQLIARDEFEAATAEDEETGETEEPV